MVALLDYVGGDYGRAVRDGQIVSPFEYEEQLRFVADARGLAGGLAPDAGPEDSLYRHLAGLDALVRARAAPAQVLRASHLARDAAVQRFGLRVAPRSRPRLERARSLYEQNCAVCHGLSGDGDTERARALDPAPARFRDPERLAPVSPYRVYNALTFGVPGTGMPAFDTLSSAERWDLAFFVFRLGHAGAASSETRMPLAELASLSDRELLAALEARGEPSPAAALAHLRHEAPFEMPQAAAPVQDAQRLVAGAVAAFKAGRHGEATRLAIDAYLQGFEPLEPELQARDPQRVARVEAAFGALRSAMAGHDAVAVTARGEELKALLFAIAEGEGKRSLPLVAALVIYFREGIEAALLVGALLATLRRMGRAEATRFVHAGWLLALPAGLATWWLFDRALTLGVAKRELVEAAVGLLAAAVLFAVSFWLISRAESRRWLAYLRASVATSLSRRSLLMLAGVSFLAVYREAAETVLFTQALLLGHAADAGQVAVGAVAGAALAAAAAFAMNRTVLRLPIGPVFAVSGGLLTLLAVSFAGASIHGLVQAGYLSPRPVTFPELPWMGIHPDLTGLAVQFTIAAAVTIAGLQAFRRRGDDTAA
ncbi:MAG TPA: FTR1 family protein [Vicinamibacteria bacterium]|nr:FTR1 family protein [Vicinamibacteria bacterium]